MLAQPEIRNRRPFSPIPRSTRFQACLLGGLLAARMMAAETPTPGPAGRLGYWRFDADDWRTEPGRPPMAFTNMFLRVPSFEGNALHLTASNGVALLRWRQAEAGGGLNLHPRQGAVRFLYRPGWVSRKPPGRWLRLFDAGYLDGADAVSQMALSVDPSGTRIVLQSRDEQGLVRTNFQVPLESPTWMLAPTPAPNPPAGTAPWTEIIVNYTPTNSSVIVGGLIQQDVVTKAWGGSGVVPLAAPAKAQAVFAVGSSLTGDLAAEGFLDELETFEHPLTPLRSYAHLEWTDLNATVAMSPPTVRLNWFTIGNRGRSVRRRALGSTNWITLAQDLKGRAFTDQSPDLRVGETYEYSVGNQRLPVALNRPPVDDRGRVILLVDETLLAPLASALNQLKADLLGDGWEVVRHEVPRHNDAAWAQNPTNRTYLADVARIKAMIAADGQSAPGRTKAVFLIGHVTIPYAGVSTEDGHPDHLGAWPTDNYYGDLDGNWSDATAVTPPTQQNPVLRNVPGDGKFDASSFDQLVKPAGGSDQTQGVELAVGRIDFARLPALRPKSELDLLRQYLDKDHRYRHGQIRFEHRGLVGGYFFIPFNNEAFPLYGNASRIASRLYAPVEPEFAEGNAFATTASYLWGIQGGFSGHDGIHYSPDANRAQGIRPFSTRLLAQPGSEPKVGFYLLKGSYFGDWNLVEDSFMPALLATPNYGLAAFWTRITVWDFDATAIGEPIGSAVLATARGKESVRTTSMLGDPTLGVFITAPPAGVTATRKGRAVTLKWTASREATVGYRVFRSVNGTNGPFTPLTPAPLTGTTFTDDSVPGGSLAYLVRALDVVTTGCGSFTNQSVGLLVKVSP